MHPATTPPKLLDRLRTALHLRGVPAPEAAAWAGWAEAFIRFHHLRHPEEMAAAEVGAFLTHLAVDRREALPRLAEARAALLFLYRDFLHVDLPDPPVTWAKAGDPAAPPGLLDQLRAALRARHYSIHTEDAYVNWARRFVLFHGKRHPVELGAAAVEAFLTDLAVAGRVSASTQMQAFCALLFLYRTLLRVDLGRLDAVRARRPEYLPVVLSRDEVRRVLDRVRGADGTGVLPPGGSVRKRTVVELFATTARSARAGGFLRTGELVVLESRI